uniref:Spiggin A alternatively spliced variant 2 n=1 Tax=Gasterosteus aculeatus TaxID=69293 RepID=A0A0H5BMI0_GASAC|nr:spiggin A alternatively spliced variant 2 [Gasterosteus aculeatus]BAS02291.1 spiggin A alternatively spliced variant 3 [Gasterosteus aculeatus]
MTTQRWILVFIFSLASVLGTVELFKTKEAQTCEYKPMYGIHQLKTQIT